MKTMYIIAILVVAAVFAFAVIVSGAEFSWYLDLPSIVVVLLPAFFLSAADHSWRILGGAFQSAFGRKQEGEADKGKLAAELLAAKALGRYAWLSALLGTFIGLLAILRSITQQVDQGRLGSNLSVGLLCAFSATCFELVVVLPLKGRLERLLKSD